MRKRGVPVTEQPAKARHLNASRPVTWHAKHRSSGQSPSRRTSSIKLADVTLAKSQTNKPAAKHRRKPARSGQKRKRTAAATSSGSQNSSKKESTLSQLLSPKNVQETMKTVTNLRGMVKNWLGYLQQADRMLDTVFVTTNSLKESGVLDKLIKQRGKNLSTEDYTSLLAALMSSPLASGFLKGDDDAESTAAKAPAGQQSQQPQQSRQPQQPQRQGPPQM